MEPLIVTAELSSGFASFEPWTPSIDGILGYWLMYERDYGTERWEQAYALNQFATIEDLPLERVENGDLWFWACSSPIYEAKAVIQRHYHRRFDFQHAERYLDGKVRTVQVQCGPYKNYRKGLMLHITPKVQWHVIGDAGEIRRLLREAKYIGKGWSRGFGRVKRWRVEPGGDPEIARHRRPLPTEYAKSHDITGPIMQWGFRPCIRKPENQTQCVMPT